jgi:hypothetical protein
MAEPEDRVANAADRGSPWAVDITAPEDVSEPEGEEGTGNRDSQSDCQRASTRRTAWTAGTKNPPTEGSNPSLSFLNYLGSCADHGATTAKRSLLPRRYHDLSRRPQARCC